SLLSWWGCVPSSAHFLTRPPNATPRRAIIPGEGFLFSPLHHHTFSPRGVAGLSFTARIGRAQEINRLHPLLCSASKGDNPSVPLLPRPRRLMRSIVLAHDDFPDPFVGKFDLPARHRGFPCHPFDREADAALLDPPEEIAFLEHGDRRWIGEVSRGRIESPGR